MPRWQRGYASGCRPEDGSSNTEKGLAEVSLPRGSKILFMVSGGIDSPVAMKLAKKYYKVYPVHFELSSFYPKSYKEKVLSMVKILKEKIGFEKMLFVPFSSVLKKASFSVKRKYICLICRKSMLKACEMLCSKYNFDAIATGEVLAQKASQTIYNMQATHFGIKKPVIMPVLCFDKDEIVKLAKKFGLSVEKHIGACRLVPRYPVTKASWKKVERFFREAELEKTIVQALENAIWIKEPEEVEEYFLKLR